MPCSRAQVNGPRRPTIVICAAALAAAAMVAGCGRPQPAVAPRLDPLQQLTADLVAATKAPGVARAAWGIVVHSLDRDERMVELNPRTLLVPASAAKLISVASAADAVGWDYRYETVVRATAPIVDGTIAGDLIVAGTGDPSIGGRAGGSFADWVAALAAQGLRRIDGRIIGDDDGVEEPRPQLAWAWDDLGYVTGALFGALNFAENRMEIVVTPGAAAGDLATLAFEPHARGRPLRNRAFTGPAGSPLLLWPEQRPGEPFLTIAGSIPADAPPTPLGVAAGNPTIWFAEAFRAALIGGGIEVRGAAVDVDDVSGAYDSSGLSTLYTHRSATLGEIAQPLLKNSINLYGEAALRLNAAPGGPPTNDAALDGLRARMENWGIPAEGWQIVDGSGLSRRNAVAAETLVAILRRMYEPAGMSPWMTGLPVAGRDGTLAGRMAGTRAEGNVRAKTGTMSNIRTLAGYARTRDGEMLAFAAMADAFDGTGAAATAAIDAIAIRLSDFSRVTQ